MILTVLLACLPAQGPAEQAGNPDQAGPAARWGAVESFVEGDEVVYRFEDLALDLPEGFLRADRALLRLDRARYRMAVERGPDTGPAAPEGGLAQGWTNRLIRSLGLPAAQTGIARSLLLEGAVEMRSPSLTLLCERLRYDALRHLTEAVRADLFLAQGQGPRGWPMRLISERLRENADGSLEAEEVALTTCDLAEPHYEVRLDSIRGTQQAEDRWSWTTSGGTLAVSGLSVLPLPTPDFETGESYFGLTGLRFFGNSSLGTAFELELGSRARLFGDSVGLDWKIAPILSERRGVPLQAELDFLSADWEGRWRFFWLQDAGRDVHPFSQQVVREGDSRHRIRMDNRFDLGGGFRLDADIALTSDPLVDPEFFNRNWIRRKDAVSELYLRRGGESGFFDALVQHRLDETGFTPIQGFGPPGSPAAQTLDSLPRIRYDAYSTSLAQIPMPLLGGADGRAALNFSWGAEAARLVLRDRDLEAPPLRPRFSSSPEPVRDRLRAWAEASLPLALGPVFLRPGVRGTANFYSDDAFGRAWAQRGAGEVFLEAGTLFLKDYPNGWQHRVLPQVRLRHRRAGGTPQPELIAFDSFDLIRSGTAVEFSLRQLYYAPEVSQPWLDLELLVPYYPEPANPLLDGLFPAPRATDRPGAWGPAEVRLIWTPGEYGEALEGLRVETRWRHDFRKGKLDEVFARLTASPHPRLRYGLGLRKVNDLFSVGDFFADWRVSDDWAFTFIQPYTFTGLGTRASQLSARYFAHDFVFELGFSRDSSAGQSGVFFNLFPRFLVDDAPMPDLH